MESLRKLLAEFETDEDSDFDNEDNRPEDVLEENFSDHENESFSERDKESEENGESGNKEVNIRNGFHQKKVYREGKQNLGRIFILVIILCCALPGTKRTAKDVTSPAKSWELFIDDNMIVQLMVE
ncbi:hypothetical protein AVEN_35162-1 [Araneus ventricosus]|uniref:Uncharacterized protein n=1 Tax=Araneus ventricosus TaxID=182803 RepID=A0A4Y2N0S1_ARAVE|nr:hypothetical protein AVEN_35162-1 [Araneus ventricosus]